MPVTTPIKDFRDFQDGFDIPGSRIKLAIVEKIEQRIDKQVTSILIKLNNLIPDVKTSVVYLAAFTVTSNPDDLSPEAAEIYQLCRHLQSLTDEVGELQQVARNLSDTTLYKLGRNELKKFGL